jgi:sialic acid synthase SpsE
MDRIGPDIACSMDEAALGELIQASLEVNKMLGGKKEELPEEKPTSDFAFATVVAIKNIQAGEKFSQENLWVKRPGTGEISEERYWDVLGRIAKRDIENGEQLKNNDL